MRLCAEEKLPMTSKQIKQMRELRAMFDRQYAASVGLRDEAWVYVGTYRVTRDLPASTPPVRAEG